MYKQEKNSPLNLLKTKTPYTKQSLDHLQPTQSNPTKIKGSFSINNLVCDQSNKKKQRFEFLYRQKNFPENIIILSLPNCPKQARRSSLPYFLHFLTNKGTSPAKSISFAEPNMTQVVPKGKIVIPKALPFCYIEEGDGPLTPHISGKGNICWLEKYPSFEAYPVLEFSPKSLPK